MKLDIHIYSLNIGTVQEMEDSLIYTRARGLSFGFGLFVYYNLITLLTQCDFSCIHHTCLTLLYYKGYTSLVSVVCIFQTGKSVVLQVDETTNRVKVIGVGGVANAAKTIPIAYTHTQPHRFWVELVLKKFRDNTTRRS